MNLLFGFLLILVSGTMAGTALLPINGRDHYRERANIVGNM